MRISLRVYLFLGLILFSASATAQMQDSLVGTYTDFRTIKFSKNISKTVSTGFITNKESITSLYTRLTLKPGIEFKTSIPNGYVTKKLILQFRVSNSTDTISSVYFFPGFFYTDMRLFRLENNQLQPIARSLAPVEDSIGFRKITLQPHDSATIIAELSFLKTYINSIRPRLVNPDYLSAFITQVKSNADNDSITTYIFSGLMLMMILFSFANFLQGANPEFLYYSGYAFLLGAMLFTKSLYSLTYSPLSFFLESYLDFIMQGIGTMFYMLFMRQFLNTKTSYPFLYKLYNAGSIMIIISALAYTFFHYFTDNFSAENLVENLTKGLLLLMTLIFLVYSLRRWNNKLLRFLFWGNLSLFVFALISQVSVMFNSYFENLPGVFSSSVFYYEAGLVLELVFFLAGLNYKNRRQIIEQTKERETLKAQNMLKEYEKEIAVYKAQQEERERISADMHDELGAGMTAIRLMSEIARNKMKENTPVEIERISTSANDVLNKMNAIIWSMNSGNDTLDNLVSYIRSYSQEYFENTPLLCKISTPEQIPDKEIAGDKRRNIFLCVKETLNNVLKHSGGTEVHIEVETGDHLTIRISDNGKGIDLEKLRQFGNGLKNIARRMETIGGSFNIESNGGTITTLTLPY